ncbi:MAG: YbhB/YbcL family Raf kinase inhibitor-like protein, partial [Verrucomicrobiales bacterium]
GGPREREEPLPQKTGGSAGFILTSPDVAANGRLPMEYTGDGAGSTLPLTWSGAPAGTKSYALIMDHLAPANEMKSYWVMWNIPGTLTSLPKDAEGIGETGVGFRGETGYEPPHSKGPGDKTYVLHLYALSAEPDLTVPASGVNREALLAAMDGRILATADLSVIYARSGEAPGDPDGKPRPR